MGIYPFDKSNLIPWSIVAFDVLERSPQERVAMIESLGYKQYAFGGRTRHIAKLEDEIQWASQEDIAIVSAWMYIHPTKDQPSNLKPDNQKVLTVLANTQSELQIWVGFHPEYVTGLTEKEALQKAISMVNYLCEEAKKVNCKIALYNHGGWFGSLRNQLDIIYALPDQDIGIIYNFHHAHDRIDEFYELFTVALPYVWCVNLNGMRKNGPKILTIGAGDLERDMIQFVLDSGYQGPYGLLGHVKGGDPKEILTKNFNGLQGLFPKSNFIE